MEQKDVVRAEDVRGEEYADAMNVLIDWFVWDLQDGCLAGQVLSYVGKIVIELEYTPDYAQDTEYDDDDRVSYHHVRLTKSVVFKDEDPKP